MKKIIKTFTSPTFTKQNRKIIIFEPKNVSAKTPVLFFFDGQILKLYEQQFHCYDGIDIFNVIKNIGPFVIIAVNSMNEESFFKYHQRFKELTNCDHNGKYLFFNKIKKEIIFLKQKYQGSWIGFGFSLSGFLLGYHQKLFDQTILVSPYFIKQNLHLPDNTMVFYGKKEYKLGSSKKINNPIKEVKKLNKKTKFIEIENMKHTFNSWNQNFSFILKNSLDLSIIQK